MGRVIGVRWGVAAMVVALLTGPAEAGLRFRNVLLGAGLIAAGRDIRLPRSVRQALIRVPALRDYAESSRKSALLIDVRFHLDAAAGWRWMPAVQFWNWGGFPATRAAAEREAEHSIRDLVLNLDMHRPFRAGQGWSPYVGLGPGLHFLAVDSKYPPAMFAAAPVVVQRVAVTEVALGVNALAGLNVRLRDTLTLFHEVRWSTSGELHSYQILIGITTL